MKNRIYCALFALLLAGCPNEPEAEGWAESFDADERGWLLSLWGPAADDLYAVGGQLEVGDVPGAGLVMRYDGTSWSEARGLPSTSLLNWVHGLSADDIYIVGNGGVALHWDGSAWSEMATPTEEDLWGVFAVAPDDVYAVGGSGRAGSEPTLIHYDGAEWSQIDVPELMRPNVFAFFKVWASGPDDVWVVGQRGVVLRFDGTEWSEQLVGTSEDVISVWGLGPDRVAMAAGRNNGTMVTWNGTEFVAHRLAPLPGFNGVWMRDPNRVHIAGNEGQLAVVDFDSGDIVSDDYQDTRLAFHAVFGSDGGRIYAVGGNFLFSTGPFRGLAMDRALTEAE